MGNIVGGLAGQPPSHALILEEQAHSTDLVLHLRRTVRNPKLRRILDRQDAPAEVASAVAGSTEPGGMTDLHIATAIWPELVEKLLESCPADRVNAASAEGYTPLHIAAMCGCTAVVCALLAKGADLQRRSRRGATALHFAAQGAENGGALHALLSHPGCTPALVNQLGYRQRSALLMALLAHGNACMVRGLLNAGANPSEKNPSMANASLLHSCAHLGRVESMRALIEAGAQVDSAATDGITVLQECFIHPPSRLRNEATKRQMFRMPVEAGANVNATVPFKNYTVLHFAMASCRDEATALLIADSGIDLSIAVNKPVLLGEASAKHSLLHLAAMRGWTRMVERLVAAGADLGQRNKDGMQPLHAAILNSQAEVVAALLALGADPLGTCPDCYPCYALWKHQRSVQAMQALMHGQDGPALLPALVQLFNANPLSEGAPRLTAVDLACCVARHIPSVEAFVDSGVLPSPQALQLAEHAVPIMRAVVERQMWTPALHRRLPPRFRRAGRELMLCLSRGTATEHGCPVTLTRDAVDVILHKAAFPVSHWATAGWLAAQHIREVPPREPAAPAAQPAPAAGAAAAADQHVVAAAGGGAAGLPQVMAGGEVPPFVQAMMQHMQQQLGVAIEPPHFVFMHHNQGGPPGAGAAAGAGPLGPPGALPGNFPGMAVPQPGAGGAAGDPGGAPLGVPPGVQMLHHHHVNQGNQQFHIMQFAIDIDLPFGMPLGGLPGLPPLPGMMPPAPGVGGAVAGAGAGAAAAAGVAMPPPGLMGMMPGLVNAMQQVFGGMGGDIPDFVFDPESEDDEDFVGGWGEAADDSETEEEEGAESGQAYVPHMPPPPGPPQPQQRPPAAAAAAAAGPAVQQPGHASGSAGPSRQPTHEEKEEQPVGMKRLSSGSGCYELRSRKRRKQE